MINKRLLSAGILAIFVWVIASVLILSDGIFVANAALPTHSFEGSAEKISLELSEAVAEPVYLDVYEFHYIMHPELAPEEDALLHNEQMNFMSEVLKGRAEPFKPSLDSEKVQKILEISPKKTIKLETENGKLFYTTWIAEHGRMFFRARVGSEYLDNIYTTRVHCKNVDMRTVEQLKGLLESIALPLEHKNSMLAAQLFDQVYSSYTQGHSLRYILMHHGQPVEEIDALFEKLGAAIKRSDFEAAKNLADEILKEISRKEEVFFSLETAKNNEFAEVKIKDNVNGFSFYTDENAEVYVREYKKPTAEELMKKLHSAPADHSMHMESLKPDKNKLTANSMKFKNSGDSFSGNISAEWKNITVVLIYGSGQNYYLTKNVEL